MKNADRDGFDSRLKNSSKAKLNRLEHFKKAANDPERVAKREERQKIAIAREEARKAKAATLLKEKEEAERLQAANAKRESAQAAVREAALEAERAANAERELAQSAARDAERKAERDRKYAARRNRKR